MYLLHCRDPDSNDVPWVRIILRQMRLLDHIVDGNGLNDRLFSVLEVAPLAVSKYISFCLCLYFSFGDTYFNEIFEVLKWI